MSDHVSKISVVIDEDIRRQSELVAAVESASHFFEEGMDFAGIDTQLISPEMFWTINTERTDVLVEYKEYPNGTMNFAKRIFPVAHLLDDVNRRTWMLRLLRDVNGTRYRRVMKRFEQMIEQLEGAEHNGQ